MEKRYDRFILQIDPRTRENLSRLSQQYGLSQSAIVRMLINSTANIQIGPLNRSDEKITDDKPY